MAAIFKKAVPAVSALGAGVGIGVVALILGQVLFTGESYGSEREPPEQIYFF
ncbi:MAG: hypothetical protein AAGI10_07520 [Pseudomonadota bacterium]